MSNWLFWLVKYGPANFFVYQLFGANKMGVSGGKISLSISESERESTIEISQRIKARRTEELILGFCGPLGSGVSTVANRVASLLENFNYKVEYLRVSDFILKQLPPLDRLISPADRISKLMDQGNLLRDKYGNNILSQMVIKKICTDRHTINEKAGNGPTQVKESRRKAFIIDGIKHPDEVDLLNLVYGEMFFLFGVLCPETIRQRWLLRNKEIKPDQASALMQRDKSEEVGHGQQLIKTLYRADFFIRNSKENINSLDAPLIRFINLILGKLDITPTRDEFAMYLAHSAALRSGCLSRQVGACITSNNGDILATGCNDVPKSGGGLYTIEDGTEDGRCMNLSGKQCQTQKFKNRINKNIQDIISEYLTDANIIENIMKNISKIERLDGLIEFSRAVHAEMDAITSVARRGSIGLLGSIMYCTTFPCHNCVRHILASGISRVYYIEPYEKSLALEQHSDSITVDIEDIDQINNKLLLIHFEGVAPKQYISLFTASGRKEKESGKMRPLDIKSAHPVTAKYLESFVEYETIVVKYLEGFKDLDSD